MCGRHVPYCHWLHREAALERPHLEVDQRLAVGAGALGEEEERTLPL